MLDKTPTADELIAKYLGIRKHLTLETKRFDEYCAPFKAQQEEILGQLLEMLNALGGDGRQSLKTDKGTAYKSVIVTPKIVDREKYLDAVLDNYGTWGAGMLQLGAPKKESIDAYLQDTNGQLPDGVETSSFVKVNVRSA